MILTGARVALGPTEAHNLDIEIRHGRIAALRPHSGPGIDLSGLLILPGLINAHDHLEFNLYPRLGHGPYPNATAWANDVYHPDRSPIREQRRIPKRTRLLWGGLKNLLCGVTTVCHHNPLEYSIFDCNFPVRVLREVGWAHSLAFSPDLAERFRAAPKNWPFVVHLGEATDAAGRLEIFRLDEIGALDSRTVLVHAVALDRAGLRLAKRKSAGIIWCPSSNLFLLGRTLTVATLGSGIPIALGSDSALTAKGDLLDELAVARRISNLPTAQLYCMVTDIPAAMLRLPNGEGKIAIGSAADLAAFKDSGRTPAETLLRRGCVPELVIKAGKVKLVSAALAQRRPHLAQARFTRLEVEGRGAFRVDADVPRLYNQALRNLATPLKLSGRKVCGARTSGLRIRSGRACRVDTHVDARP